MYKLSKTSSVGILLIDEKNSVPSRVEFLDIIVAKSNFVKISVIQYCIMSASNPESSRRSCKRSVFRGGIDPFVELSVPPD